MTDSQYCGNCGTEQECMTFLDFYKRCIKYHDDEITYEELRNRYCPRCKELTAPANKVTIPVYQSVDNS